MPPVGERATIKAALPGTVHEIMASTGLSRRTVYRWVSELMAAEPRECHIGKWPRKNGMPTPKFHAGPGVDATKPKPKTDAYFSRKSRKKRNEEKAEFESARHAANTNAERAARTPQNWASALGLGA